MARQVAETFHNAPMLAKGKRLSIIWSETNMNQILHSSENSIVEWIDDGQIVLKRFTDHCIGAEMRHAFQAGLDGLKAHNGCKWLSDDREYRYPFPPDDARWISEWVQQMLNAGGKYWAVVEPENISMKDFMVPYQQMGVKLQIYRNLNDALAWLRSL